MMPILSADVKIMCQHYLKRRVFSHWLDKSSSFFIFKPKTCSFETTFKPHKKKIRTILKNLEISEFLRKSEFCVFPQIATPKFGLVDIFLKKSGDVVKLSLICLKPVQTFRLYVWPIRVSPVRIGHRAVIKYHVSKSVQRILFKCWWNV